MPEKAAVPDRVRIALILEPLPDAGGPQWEVRVRKALKGLPRVHGLKNALLPSRRCRRLRLRDGAEKI
jgi:hypothetical protein